MRITSAPPFLALAFAATLSGQGVQWQPVPTTGAQPDLWHAAMATDPIRGRTVLFGVDVTTQSPETWEWDGATWLRMAPSTQPPTRDRGAMAFDPTRQRILFTGGFRSSIPPTGFDDAWEWDGAAWQQLPAVTGRPVALRHGVATDLVNGRLLLVDEDSAIKVWDGATWQVLATVPLPFQFVYGIDTSTAWDPLRGRLVVQVWGYDLTYPPPFFTPTYVSRWTMFEWDGSVHSVPALPGGYVFTLPYPMFFDGERQRVGVWHLPSTLAPLRTWEWSGTWSVAGQQNLLVDPLFAVDPATGATVVYDPDPNPAQPTRFFRLVSATPATVTSAGNGCAGALGVPTLAAAEHSRPWLGDVFAVAMENVPAGSFPFVVAGLATAQLGLGNLGMPACQQLVTLDSFAAMAPAPGQRATWSLALPPVPALVGRNLHLQGGLLAGGGAGPLGGALSQRLSATLGLR